MKLDKNELLIEVFEIDGSTFDTITVEELRAGTSKCQPEEVRLPLRDRVLEVNFNDHGFKELNKSPASYPKEVGFEGLKEYFDNNFMGLTILEVEGDWEAIKVAPNYIVNIKNNEVFNLFDTIGRMGYYNFLTDIMGKDSNNWKIVSAPAREFHLTHKQFFDLYPWTKSLVGIKDNESEKVWATPITTIDEDDILPIKEVNDLLKDRRVSLVPINVTLMKLARDYKKGEITQDQINHDYLINKYGKLSIMTGNLRYA